MPVHISKKCLYLNLIIFKLISISLTQSLTSPPLHSRLYSLPKFDHHCGFRVISALMNSTVLSLTHSSETGMPISDETVTGVSIESMIKLIMICLYDIEYSSLLIICDVNFFLMSLLLAFFSHLSLLLSPSHFISHFFSLSVISYVSLFF